MTIESSLFEEFIFDTNIRLYPLADDMNWHIYYLSSVHKKFQFEASIVVLVAYICRYTSLLNRVNLPEMLKLYSDLMLDMSYICDDIWLENKPISVNSKNYFMEMTVSPKGYRFQLEFYNFGFFEKNFSNEIPRLQGISILALTKFIKENFVKTDRQLEIMYHLNNIASRIFLIQDMNFNTERKYVIQLAYGILFDTENFVEAFYN